MKRIAALLLTLCLLIGMPMLIQAEETTEDTFEVSHVVEMPDWMAKNPSDKGRTLLLYFNSDPVSAPPTNWRYFIAIVNDPNAAYASFVCAKYNDSYVFDNHNPIAITMMTQDEADNTNYSSGKIGYDNGTIQDYFAEKAGGKGWTLHAVIADNDRNMYEEWDGFLLAPGSFKNANGTKLKGNRVYADGTPIRQNGYNHLTPAVEEALTLDKVAKSGDNTFVAEFSEPLSTNALAELNKKWFIELRITNLNGDTINNQGEDLKWVPIKAESISLIEGETARYAITFLDGAISELQATLDTVYNSRQDRDLRLCLYGNEKVNCFLDFVTAADGNPLLITHPTTKKAGLVGDTGIKGPDWEQIVVREVNEISGKRYASLEKALAVATASGQTVQLRMDLYKDMVMVPAGVTLDLNGHELETNILMSFGKVIDGKDGEGKLVTSNTASSVVHIQPDNPDMPLYDTDGYRFFTYTLASAGPKDGTANSVKFGAQLTFENTDAYALLANGGSAAFDMKLSVTANNKVTNLTYSFNSDVLEAYHEAWINPNRAEGQTPTLVLSVSGIAGINNISCTPHVYSTTTFAGQTGSELNYSVSVAE